MTNNKNYISLELDKILEMLSDEAAMDETKEKALQTEPSADLNTVKYELAKTVDAFEMSVKYGTPPFRNIKNISASLSRAKSGSNLSLKELLDTAKALNGIRMITDWYRQCENTENSLSGLFVSLTPNKMLEEKIYNSIISEDEVADTASSTLANIRRRILQAGVKVRESLDKMVRSSSVQKILQENLITMRDGRYVLPVKAENKNELQGLVHDTSASGSTIFIEPISVVEANNDIRMLKIEEHEEIERIIASLSAECASFADSLTEDCKTCAELDLYFAKSNLGAKMKACCPQITDDGSIILKNARHPLINPQKVVPISLELNNEHQALIITGPNTGGKTVVLKTVGLLTLMAMCGLMIPVSDGSKITVFKNILVDIGDKQSIEMSLSTFSSHMNNVIGIMKESDERSLVLLDELGSGTDPVEGAALAVSVIEKLRNSGCRLLVTTHYQELKMYAIQHEKIENASCEFDVNTLQPTYRLITGSPGKSNAFAISSRLGAPDDVINYAKSLVSDENKRFEEAVEQLEKTRTELEKQNDEIRMLKEEHRRNFEILQSEIERFNSDKESELEKARIQAMRIVENARMTSEKLIDELDMLRREKENENFSQQAIEARSRTRSVLDKMYLDANPVVERRNDNYKLPRPLKRGDSVNVVSLGKNGIVACDPDGKETIFVQIGAMRTKVKVTDLKLNEKTEVNKSTKRTAKKTVTSKMERRPQMELDIRGNTVDEGLHELGLFLDNAIMSNVGIVTIIHGKGTGVLRTAVHHYLKQSSAVKSFRLGVYGEGEDGVTIAELS